MEFSPTMVMKINVKVNGYFDGASHLQLLVSVNTRRSGLNYPCLKRVNREIDVSMCGQKYVFFISFSKEVTGHMLLFFILRVFWYYPRFRYSFHAKKENKCDRKWHVRQ